MYKNSLGYIFECKKDLKNAIGIKEGFTFSYREDSQIQRISAVFSIDINGNILCPSYYDKALGLVPVTSRCSKESMYQDIAKFVRSNRATYSLASATYLICTVEARISKITHQWVEDSVKINFYVPKGSMPLAKLIGENTEEWGIACDIAASSGKLNTFPVNDGILNAYRQLVLNQLADICVGDKNTYIRGRVERYMQ